jgi:hypothetical protein
VTRESRAAIGAIGVAAAYATLLGVAHLVPRYDCLVFPFVAWLVLRLLRGLRGRHLALPLVAVGVILAAGVVTHLWTTGHEGRTAALLGFAPYSDAAGYYSDAHRLVHGLKFESSSKRPLYPALFGALLRFLGRDSRVVIGLFTLLGGASVGYATYETTRAHGERAGLVVFLVTAFWERRYAGFIATENGGFPLGILAFGLLLRAAEAKDERPREAEIALGAATLALSMGLLARAGPMFVPPMIVLWALWAFPNGARARAAGLAVLAGVVAAVLNTLLTRRIAGGALFGDFPPILYGMLHGEDFTEIKIRHPEIDALPPEVRPGAVLRQAWADVVAQPSLAVTGPGRALLHFFVGPHGLFSFVWTNPDDKALEDGAVVRAILDKGGARALLAHVVGMIGLRGLANAIAMGALGGAFVLSFLVGLAHAVRARKNHAHYTLALACTVGVLLSTPFTPGWITEGCQVQTTTIALLALVPALLAARARGAPRPRPPEPIVTRRLSALALASIGLATFLVAVAIAWPQPTPAAPCAERTKLHLDPSMRVELAQRRTLGPDLESLSANLAYLGRRNPELARSVTALARPGVVAELVYDGCDGRGHLAFGPPDALPAGEGGWVDALVEEQVEPYVMWVARPAATPPP